MFTRASFITACTFLFLAVEIASGQQAVERTSPDAKPRKGRPVMVVQDSFEPAFRIEPLSQHLDGRAGDELAFKFTLEAADRVANIEVLPMGLRQDITGLILHDEAGSQVDAIRLVTPTKMTLQPNKPVSIEGIVRIPQGDAKFHSFGILVRDIGANASLNPLSEDGKRKTQAGIRFVTQYVLRLDVGVENARGEEETKLQIENVRMVPFQGLPRLQATVWNPTDTTFEYEMRAKVRSSPTDRSAKALYMAMPIRASMETKERYVGRILPKCRVRMEELVAEQLAGGKYEVDIEMLVKNRVIHKKTFDIEIDAKDYPAQEVLVAQVGESLQASPAQIQISQLRGGNRRESILLKNTGADSKTVTLEALNEHGLELTGVTIQPKEVTIAPGGSRKVSVLLQYQKDPEDDSKYGQLVISSKSDKKSYPETRPLPMAVLFKKGTSPAVTMSDFTVASMENYTAIRTKVVNNGKVHHSLDAKLTISKEDGQTEVVPGGFGRWLMPGATDVLEFRLDHPLTAGKYRMRCAMNVGDKTLIEEKVFEATESEQAISPTVATSAP